MFKSWSFCIANAIILLASSCTPSFGQGYGITAQAQITAALTPYTLDGVTYSPACIVNAPNPLNPEPQHTYSMMPFQCGGSYEGQISPQNLALYTETAIGYVN